MGILDKFFGSSKRKEDETFEVNYERMPPLERFVYNFTSNNGKFLIARSQDEIIRLLQQILTEENKPGYWTLDENIREELLKDITHYPSSHPVRDAVMLSYAHFLVENRGEIMVTSLETGNYRMIDLPRTMVFLASPAQLIQNKEKGLELVNKRYKNAVPSVNTLHDFNQNDNEFSKNVYLILYV